MNTCTRPLCGGAIEDGYCTVCGLADAPAPVMSGCASCGGTIEDGYCTVCGLADAPAPVPARVAATARHAGWPPRRHRYRSW